MGNQKILEDLKEILENIFNIGKEKLSEKTLINSLNFSDLVEMDFVFEVERKYFITILDSQFDKCETLEELIILIQNKIN